jgi:1,4-alpha-glucan branching enzyme
MTGKTDHPPQGFLALVLHAHLPYVRHPEHEDFLEEDWLYEAITETYIPLIDVFAGLVRDRIPFRITMSVTPTLAGMLADPLLQGRYVRHIEQLIELSEKEIKRTRDLPEFHPLAVRYNAIFRRARAAFVDEYGRNLLQAFRKFQDLGVLEIITCGATHGFLPLMLGNRNLWRGQIRTAARDYERHFGCRPRGIWLPECGYEPGVDEILAEEEIRFFILDTHGLLHASPRPKFGVYAPIVTNSGVAVFARDPDSSKSVWSSEEGYPGDHVYREFYRDVGWDLDYDYVRPYLHGDGQRSNLGIKYYRITGKGDHKEPYDFERAREKVALHAGNFMFNREKQIEHLSGIMDRPPLIVAPYDAELYGHWWYEGPQFLDLLLRKVACDQKTISTITPSEYLAGQPVNQIAMPSMSSWGYKGYCEVWLEGSNDWIYRHLHQVGARMIELANAARQGTFGDAGDDAGGSSGGHAGLRWRALRQAARELLLAQSSDWAFIMKTGTMTSYAIARTREHVMNFTKLYSDIKAGTIDEQWLASIEAKNNIFPEIDPLVWGD